MVWYTMSMKKKSTKKTKCAVQRTVTRKKSAKTATRNRGVPIGYSIFKSSQLPTKAVAYDKRNGKEVLLRDKRYIPGWVLDELTDEEVSRMLLKNDAKK